MNLALNLEVGNYFIYAKVEPTIRYGNRAFDAQLTLYGAYPSRLHPMPTDPTLLHTVFLNHARNHKRQYYHQNKLWTAWRLIPQGGYAYMAFGSEVGSGMKFMIRFDEG